MGNKASRPRTFDFRLNVRSLNRPFHGEAKRKRSLTNQSSKERTIVERWLMAISQRHCRSKSLQFSKMLVCSRSCQSRTARHTLARHPFTDRRSLGRPAFRKLSITLLLPHSPLVLSWRQPGHANVQGSFWQSKVKELSFLFSFHFIPTVASSRGPVEIAHLGYLDKSSRYLSPLDCQRSSWVKDG
jgi:hypothetical protein